MRLERNRDGFWNKFHVSFLMNDVALWIFCCNFANHKDGDFY